MITDYWLIDLTNASVIVHRDPTAEGAENPTFQSVTNYRRGDTILALAVDELSVSCDFLLELANKPK